LLPFLAGCVSPNSRTDFYQPAPPLSPAGIVFVANGAGDFRTVTQNLSQVFAQAAVPLQIETVAWSRGYRRYLADQVDHANHLEQGRLLAYQIAAYRQAYPRRRVYLMGHSAGCAVVLAAAEMLPPDIVDRIILLAPSVCQSYDLRPSLRASRCGIDAFHSSQDRVILGLGMRLFGTADRSCRTAAGHGGFIPVVIDPAAAQLYSKLRQHPWDPVVEWTGHDGGHFGNNQVEFLRSYVLPLLLDN